MTTNKLSIKAKKKFQEELTKTLIGLELLSEATFYPICKIISDITTKTGKDLSTISNTELFKLMKDKIDNIKD